jgi:hypothetical protein
MRRGGRVSIAGAHMGGERINYRRELQVASVRVGAGRATAGRVPTVSAPQVAAGCSWINTEACDRLGLGTRVIDGDRCPALQSKTA